MIKALVLTGDGINCEEETAFALTQAGAQGEILHINALIEAPERLKSYQILALPGGFSFGDEVSSGKILALKLRHSLGDVLNEYIENPEHLVIGVCNGFQALVKLGVLPRTDQHAQQITLTQNRQKRFINRWVSLQAPQGNLFFDGLDRLMLPIRHGEGRLVVPMGEEGAMESALQPHIALTYTEDVNGSFLQIAGLINEKGNVLGLMPHPEAFVRWTQHPAWTSLTEAERADVPAGKIIFDNMIKALRN
jgi:phosphoribosylformylglycinamidine synthase subunit PurQ / glutaminase